MQSGKLQLLRISTSPRSVAPFSPTPPSPRSLRPSPLTPEGAPISLVLVPHVARVQLLHDNLVVLLAQDLRALRRIFFGFAGFACDCEELFMRGLKCCTPPEALRAAIGRAIACAPRPTSRPCKTRATDGFLRSSVAWRCRIATRHSLLAGTTRQGRRG